MLVFCTNTKTFNVINSELATITSIEVNDFEENLTALITITGNGNYSYSIDGVNFQNTPFFNLPEPGEYRIYIKEEYCGTISDTFFAISYPKFFTPNNDGDNDTWSAKGMENYPNAVIYIYDRYGKLITSLTPRNLEWNGTFNERALPSEDYWFVSKINTYIPEQKGHFSLKR